MKISYKRFNEYVVLDLETTGLSKHWDEIIEVSCIKIKNGMITDEFTTLVKPLNAIDEFITELTGITNEMVEDSPRIEDVIPAVANFIQNHPIVGQNISFDINFLIQNNIAYNFDDCSYCDTMYLGRRILKDLHHHRLDDFIEFFNLEISDRHRSLGDCIATYLSYERMHDKIENENLYSLLAKKKHSKLDLKVITKTDDLTDEDNALYKRSCVFTGVLDKMTRKEAAQIVVNLGGYVENTVTKKTNFLILGCNDYCKSIKDGKSIKQKKAEKLILQGQELFIITEDEFYDLIGESIQTAIA